MKGFRALTILIILTLGLAVYTTQPVSALPQLPSSFWGTVMLNGSPVPAGTTISARINGVEYGHTTTILDAGVAWYAMDVPGDDPEASGTQGGVEGDTIVFFIGSIQAAQTGIWHTGTNVVLNLTGSGTLPGFTIFLPFVRR
jgi:hypothetical protein